MRSHHLPRVSRHPKKLLNNQIILINILLKLPNTTFKDQNKNLDHFQIKGDLKTFIPKVEILLINLHLQEDFTMLLLNPQILEKALNQE